MPGVNEQVVDSVASSNFKNLGDSPAFYTSMGHANAVSHQQRLNLIAETGVAASMRALSITPQEEASANATSKNADVSSLISALLASLSSSQQAVKTAQSTPRETGL